METQDLRKAAQKAEETPEEQQVRREYQAQLQDSLGQMKWQSSVLQKLLWDMMLADKLLLLGYCKRLPEILPWNAIRNESVAYILLTMYRYAGEAVTDNRYLSHNLVVS